MREQAIAEYHGLLATDLSLTPEFFNSLKERMLARRLAYGERPIGVALRPHLLTRAQYDALAYASATLASAFEKIIAALVAEPRLMDLVGMRERERSLALVNPGFQISTVTTRLDAFLDGEQLKFVEYNAENPSSLGDQSGLNEVLFEVGAMAQLATNYRLRQFDPPRAFLNTALEIFRQWSGTERAPRVAIIDWANLPTRHEFILLRNYFVGQGVPTIICTPDELEYSRGTLRCGDFSIDLVYKRVIIHELLSRYDETHPLMRAYVDGRVCLINPFRCKIAHKKAAFEFLTDDAYAGWFDAREHEVIRRTVPWTRVFRERHTCYRGESIELVEYVRRRRAQFILKPNDDYGGHGILLGKYATEAAWDEMISRALDNDYIVQETIELRTEEFPVFDDERWALQPMYVDTNPFLFNGRVEGALVRLSDSPIVNVTSGGGETGLMVIESTANDELRNADL